jgi:rare lipoprotein A
MRRAERARVFPAAARRWPLLAALAVALVLGGCGGAPKRGIDLDQVPGAKPRVEPKARYGNMKSYVVFGKTYFPQETSREHSERGVASWYGTQFHGKKTSSGEWYDMHQMTAAHKTLPLPSYVLVTNLENGRNLIVKVNDRGPFIGERIIDLSYAAAKALGMDKQGLAQVLVTSIDPRDHDGELPSTLKIADAALAEHRARDSGVTRAATGSRDARRVATAARSEPSPTPPAARRVATAPAPRALPAAAPAAVPPPAQPAVASSGGGYYLQVGAFTARANAEQMRTRLNGELDTPISIADGSALYRVRIGPLGSRGDAEQIAGELAAIGVGPVLVVPR